MAAAGTAAGTIDALVGTQESTVYNPDNSQAQIEIATLGDTPEQPEPRDEPAADAACGPPWDAAANLLLHEAARLCTAHGVDAEAFMSGAWSAYLSSRPGMREHIEEQQLRDQIEDLRKRGRLPTA